MVSDYTFLDRKVLLLLAGDLAWRNFDFPVACRMPVGECDRICSGVVLPQVHHSNFSLLMWAIGVPIALIAACMVAHALSIRRKGITIINE